MENQQTKKPLLEPNGRPQLLKDKVGKGLPKEHTAEDSVGAEAEEEASQVEDAEGEYDVESDDDDEKPGLQTSNERSAIKATNNGSDFEDADEGSRLGHTMHNFNAPSPKASGTEDPDSLDAPEDDEYTVEAVKSSRRDSTVSKITSRHS
jgi:hypothetical protein